MRFLWATILVLVGISVGSMAQKTNSYNVKPTGADPAPKSTAPAKTPAATSAGTSTSKELRSVERESAKGSSPAHTGKKGTRTVGLRSEKNEHNPPMNFGGKSGSGTGLAKQGNPYAGRLKQKGASAHN